VGHGPFVDDKHDDLPLKIVILFIATLNNKRVYNHKVEAPWLPISEVTRMLGQHAKPSSSDA
jgi:hypothetical protein